MGSPEHKQKIWNLISKIGVGMLVTHDNKVGIRGRPMQIVQSEYDGTLYFYTDLTEQNSDEIIKVPEVCVIFSDPENKVYVSMSGVAEVSADRSLIERFWSREVAKWYPEGKQASYIGMLKIKINHGEHWDITNSKLGFLYESTKSKILNKKPELGENETF